MASMKYCDKHNQVGFLKKPEESAGFAEIVDFLKGSHIRYALTHNPTIHDSLVKQFWQTATASTLADGTLELKATIDTLEYTITEASVRRQEGQSIIQPPSTSPPHVHPAPPPIPAPEPTPTSGSEYEPMEHIFEQQTPEHQPLSPRQEIEVPQSQDPTQTHEPAERTMTVEDLLQLVPTLITKIDGLETELKQTKLTMGKAIVKLVKKVKKLEDLLKRKRVVLSDSEDEEAENSSKQGRNLQKDKSEVFETPKQGKSSGDTNISPQGLEAAETLAEALSQIKIKRRNVKVRRRLNDEDVSTGFEISTSDDVSTGFTYIKSASEKVKSGDEQVNTDSIKVSIPSPVRSRREGKAPMTEEEETQASKKTKE
ncbi:hypothetical protein Tco_1018689 [Tanacetum coccineum]|uniref:Xylulose kinase-1 n=1 Tax=Tanacetum coccineum TaxID=301880 RepID=A0ABQ5FVC9_9ASTR